MKKILITGASGYLANQLINEFVSDGFDIAAMTSNPENIFRILKDKSIEIISNDSVISGSRSLCDIDVVIHTAFCRKSDGNKLYQSLLMMQKLVEKCKEYGIKGFINISSQSVYGSQKKELSDEHGIIAPDYLYAMAKVSSEMLLDQMVSSDTELRYTNVRLASLIGPGNKVPENILSKFIVSALHGIQFNVIGGGQKFSWLDVRDAARAIYLLALKNPKEWDPQYNLGPEKQINILELADEICSQAKELYGIEVMYQFTPEETLLNAGMNSKKIYTYLNWKPKYSFSQTAEDTFKAKHYELFGE